MSRSASRTPSSPHAPLVSSIFSEAGSPIAPEHTEVLGRYVELLFKWSRRSNLTGFKEPAAAIEGLLLDAAQVALLLPEQGLVVDVGAGAGGLAVALRLLCPGIELCLAEPLGKRAAFLRALRRELGLSGFEVEEVRAESLAGMGADAAYAKAVLPVPEWVALGMTLLRPGGRLLCLTARPPKPSELPAALRLVDERRYRLPRSGALRTVTALSVPAAAAGPLPIPSFGR